jgi:hypothetical protein
LQNLLAPWLTADEPWLNDAKWNEKYVKKMTWIKFT